MANAQVRILRAKNRHSSHNRMDKVEDGLLSGTINGNNHGYCYDGKQHHAVFQTTIIPAQNTRLSVIRQKAYATSTDMISYTQLRRIDIGTPLNNLKGLTYDGRMYYWLHDGSPDQVRVYRMNGVTNLWQIYAGTVLDLDNGNKKGIAAVWDKNDILNANGSPFQTMREMNCGRHFWIWTDGGSEATRRLQLWGFNSHNGMDLLHETAINIGGVIDIAWNGQHVNVTGIRSGNWQIRLVEPFTGQIIVNDTVAPDSPNILDDLLGCDWDGRNWTCAYYNDIHLE